jgi:polyhydroxyalkanoate synthesis regulator phasin
VAQPKDKRPKTRTDAVRAAVDQAFQATAGQAQVTRERAQEIADELAAAAGRVRDALDELRPAGGDDLRELTARVRSLEAKVAALESGGGQSTRRTPHRGQGPASSKKRTASGKPAKRQARGAGKRPPRSSP